MPASFFLVLPSARLFALALLASASLLHFSGRLPEIGWLVAMVLALLVLVAVWPMVCRLQPSPSARPQVTTPVTPKDRDRRRQLLNGTRVAVALLVAGLLLTWRVHDALQERLPTALEGSDLEVVGVVDSMPQRFDFGDRIRFTLAGCRIARTEGLGSGLGRDSPLASRSDATCGRLARVQLDWGPLAEKHRRPPDEDDEMAAIEPVEAIDDAVWPQPGQYWRLTVRLKRAVAPVNPGGFDLELRYLQQGIGAVGRVYARERLKEPPPGPGWRPGAAILVAFEGWRTMFRDRLEAVYAHRLQPASRDRSQGWALLGVVSGLALGDQGAIGAGLWGLFSRTGVSHLIAISGMHVTMLALVVAWAAGIALRQVAKHGGPLARLLVRLPRQVLVLGIAVLVAFGYALLSGWGIPSQRTCWMLAIAALTSLSGRGRGAMDVTLLAAGVVVAVDPWAVATAGFLLSFGAVIAILWCAHAQESQELQRVAVPGVGSIQLPSALRQAIASQWAATVGLAPPVAALFATASLIGPVANAVAIPWVSFLVTPLAVAAALLSPLAEPLAALLLQANLWLIASLMAMLQMLDSVPSASVAIATPGPWTLLCALAGAAVSIAPTGFPMRAAGPLCLVPMMLSGPRPAAQDELRITALDIGQGSSILVEAGPARLLFDAGQGSGVDRSAVARFLLPYLRSRGIESIDTLVVSHLDAQHAGGAAAVLQALRPARLLAAFDVRLLNIPAAALAAEQVQACVAGSTMPLGSARVEVLHPPTPAANRQAARDDAGSCVLRISSAAGSLLLPGDLPAATEASLVSALRSQLRADVLFVPRQGSRTATGPLLLAAVQPTHALLQVGYLNRHRHPHPAVLERLEQAGVRLLRTDEDGAVQLRLRPGRPAQVRRWRRDAPPYWRLAIDAGPATATVTAPSNRRRSARPRPAPGPHPASIGMPRARRSAPASRTPRRAASRLRVAPSLAPG